MSKNENNYNKQYVERKCDYNLTFLLDFLEMLKSFFNMSFLSDEIEKRFDDLYNQARLEYGELDCYELEGEYVVQYGYNKVQSDKE